MENLINLKNIYHQYTMDGNNESVLKGITLSIEEGEMVAIIGASGSGKSTLMNIIGCLDKSSHGEYIFSSSDTSLLRPNEIAQLRRERIGFVFQSYNLLSHLDVLHNVELPAIYQGIDKNIRKENATRLLDSLGLKDKIGYKPNQLSGGQQQRVSIARALINGARVILADEPTGALDSVSGRDVMDKLKLLNNHGYTVIIVTHDADVAQECERVIRLHDGQIISDTGKATTKSESSQTQMPLVQNTAVQFLGSTVEACSMAIGAIRSNKLRSILTMLGIIIGIASVALILILSNAAQQLVLKDLKSIGTNTINIYPGADFGDDRPESSQTLTYNDIDALRQQNYSEGVTSSVTVNLRARNANIDVPVITEGVSPQYFTVYGISFSQGKTFTKSNMDSLSPVVILDKNTARVLFPQDNIVLGKVLMLGQTPVTIVGVVEDKIFSVGNKKSLKAWLPYSTMQVRVTGQYWVDSITVRLKNGYNSELAEKLISRLMEIRHGKKDFFIYNMDSFLKTVDSITQALQLLLTIIAVISLFVGGVGVMNIMLVSVSERTKEIGIRMAIGARNKNILFQFLIESIIICLTGGMIGVLFSLISGEVAQFLLPAWKISFPIGPLLIAVLCSISVGLISGWYPAYKASKLKPAEALNHS